VRASHGGRLPALDWIKALAIAAVTVTHASPFLGDPRFTDVDRFTTAVTAFQIPAFLFVSGFLSDTGMASGLALVRRRLGRILPPYVIASLVMCAFGFWTFDTVRRFVFVMVTGEAIGIYYYVPVLVLCTMLVPLWSRLDTRTLTATTLALFVYAEAAWIHPSWRLTENFFWGIRDPFGRFHLGHFLLGIIAARRLADLRRLQARSPWAVCAAAAAPIVAFVWLASGPTWWAFQPLLLTPYMVGIAALVAALVPARPAPTVIRLLSDTTLAIYLYHWIARTWLMPWGSALSPPWRIALVSATTLAATALVALAARRALGGRWSRTLIGA
jgi:peptidoglycan/LPS O-acetylase OafA/YrhL